MTARTKSPLAIDGTGRGKKVVTKPITKKRGASVDRSQHIADNRKNYLDLSSIPTADIAAHVDPNKPLTEKAKLFVKLWAQGESIPNASARAGYGDGATYAYRVARFPQAVALYEAEKAAFEADNAMSRRKVMDGLLEGIEMAKLMAEPASMISGWKTIGQMCGYFEPVKQRIDINVNSNVVMQRMNGLSDAELLKLINDGVAQQVLTIPGAEE